MEGKKSKKTKKKWISVPASTVLEPRKTTTSSNWADEVDRVLDGNGQSLHLPKVDLPTAPKASRGSVIDDSKIPTVGPFQVHISNIPYDLSEEELTEVFQNLKVKSVKLAREEKTAKPKGYGYVEFEDRNSLSAALSLGDTMVKGRSIKIDLPNNQDMGRGNRMRSNRDRDQGSSDRTTGNWRSGPRQDDYEDRSYNRDRGYGDDRRREGGGGFGGGGGGSGYSRGGYDREERGFSQRGGGAFDREERGERVFDRGGGSGRDDRGGFRERFGGGGGGRDGSGYSYNDRGFRDRGREEIRFSRNEDRGGGGGGGSWRDDQPRGGFSGGGGGRFEDRGRDGDRGRFGDRDRGFGGDRERGGGGGYGGDRDRDGSRYGPPRRDNNPPVDRGEGRNRQKLVLQPRSKPLEDASDSGSTSNSIFGLARPVDTAAREREIEERLMRSEEFADSGRGRSGPGSTGSGSREDRRERQWEPSEKRMESVDKHVEPAPPPKENAWTRKTGQITVNNGRSSPEDEGSRHTVNSVDRQQDDSKFRREREKRV